ncbi:MAG: bifunctional metallophosphatase/5'-nucleotidase [Lachnospiraceae bacterium]
MKNRELYIAFTSDTHGHVFPVDYATGKRQDGGLLCLARHLQTLDRNPDFPGQTRENTLVLDGGDSLQGTPLTAYYLSHAGSSSPHPVAEAFNACGLSYYTLGNHDFNFGYNAIRDYLRAMKAQCVAANVVDKRGELPIVPYVIHTMPDGLRVGITAAVTDWVNVWEQKQNLTELEITEPEEALRRNLEVIRDRCDITVGIYHGGFEEDLKTGEKLSDTTENIACRIMRDLDFDLLLTGHQHIEVPSFDLAGTHACQPKDQCGSYCSMKIEETCPGTAGKDGKFTIVSKIVPSGSEEDRDTAGKIRPVEQAAQKWLDEPIGELESEIQPEPKLTAALYGSRVAALFNAVQLEKSGADFSCTSLGNNPIGFHKAVTMREVTAAYQFSNTLMVLEVTKDTIRASLERMASYFALKDGKPEVSEIFLQPKIEHYNYDFWANLDYAFDLRRPVGSRVVRMKKMDGTELSDSEKYLLVTSNYRATGTGGYDAIGRSRVVRSTTDEMPDLLADYIRRHSPVHIPENSRLTVVWKDGQSTQPTVS